ncbi:MAG: hypothetical protein E6H73_07940, partial [Betaproteobacteria bacterium]
MENQTDFHRVEDVLGHIVGTERDVHAGILDPPDEHAMSTATGRIRWAMHHLNAATRQQVDVLFR